MKSTKIKEIRSIIMLAKKTIDEKNEINENYVNELAFNYGYLKSSIDAIYKILQRSNTKKILKDEK